MRNHKKYTPKLLATMSKIDEQINQNKNNLIDVDIKKLFKEYPDKNLALILIEDSNSSNKKIYLKTMAKYREGLVSSMELSQSGADYSQAQADNAQAIYNLLIAKTNYNRSVGN